MFFLENSLILLLGAAQSAPFLLQPCLPQTISFTEGKDSWGYIFYFTILNPSSTANLAGKPKPSASHNTLN